MWTTCLLTASSELAVRIPGISFLFTVDGNEACRAQLMIGNGESHDHLVIWPSAENSEILRRVVNGM